MPIVIPKKKPAVPAKPEPQACLWCKHTYMQPCHGENPSCPNLLYLQEKKK